MLRRLKRQARKPPIHVGDPRFDDWDLVRDFEDLDSARAWRQHLEEAGFAAIRSAAERARE